VYHGLNVEFTDLLAAAPPARPPDRPVVVSVGRFVAKKGFDVLVRAVAELRDRGTLVDLELIGESGDQDAAIHQLVADLGLGDVVTISGPATQPELLARYRQATCFALACRVDADGDRDGIPNVLVEAMASGLPVVSTTVSGIPELVRDHENGLLVAPEDPHALADALATLIAEPGLAARLAVAGAATVHDEFDGSLLAAKLAALFSGAPA
jgi:glycosyltransferase involved in cell wall biosynthesis